MAKSTSYDGVISKVHIGIYFTKTDLNETTRSKVVLEEIIQSLGIIGDSYSHPGSLFFETMNPAKTLTALDINVLSLLYEPAIPPNYARKAFEDNFGEELYHVDSSKKIKNLLQHYPDSSYKDVERSFTGDLLLKHPKETNVYLYGSSQQEDSLTIQWAVSALNKITPDINIRLVQPSGKESDEGIILILRQLPDQKEPVKRTNKSISGSDCMFPKVIKNRVDLSYGNSVDKQLRQRSIVDAIYFSLVPIPQDRSRNNNLFVIQDQVIRFTPRYANLLKLIYSNDMVDGLKRSDFIKIKSTLAR